MVGTHILILSSHNAGMGDDSFFFTFRILLIMGEYEDRRYI